jgi:hypothetical protein
MRRVRSGLPAHANLFRMLNNRCYTDQEPTFKTGPERPERETAVHIPAYQTTSQRAPGFLLRNERKPFLYV